LRELRALDAIEQERVQVGAQRDDVAARLAALPAPRRSVLGRIKDPHAAERPPVSCRRRRRSSTDRARHPTRPSDRDDASLPAIRDERDALDRREGQVQREAHELLDQLVNREIVASPAWACETFGERPDNPRPREQWDRGVRAVARFRIQHDVAEEIPAPVRSRAVTKRAARGDRPRVLSRRSRSGSAAASTAAAPRTAAPTSSFSFAVHCARDGNARRLLECDELDVERAACALKLPTAELAVARAQHAPRAAAAGLVGRSTRCRVDARSGAEYAPARRRQPLAGCPSRAR
jgi:hypothetical protein